MYDVIVFKIGVCYDMFYELKRWIKSKLFKTNNNVPECRQFKFDVTIHSGGKVLVFDGKYGKSVLTCNDEKTLTLNDLSEIVIKFANDCSDGCGIEFSAENYKHKDANSIYDGKIELTFTNTKRINFVQWFKQHHPDIDIVGNAFGYDSNNATFAIVCN